MLTFIILKAAFEVSVDLDTCLSSSVSDSADGDSATE